MKKRKIGILVILQKTARVSFFGKPPPQSKPSPTSIPPSLSLLLPSPLPAAAAATLPALVPLPPLAI